MYGKIKQGVEKEWIKKGICTNGIFFSISYMPMHDIFDCTQKKKKKKNQMQKKKESKYFYVILQACFLGYVRVIWFISLGDSHFQTNVIDNIENLFDYYLHITFFVLCILTSCTYYTQIFAKFYTYDYV